jgi:hypothetical protein
LADGLVKFGPDLASQTIPGVLGGWGFLGLGLKNDPIPESAIGPMVGIDLPQGGQKLP